MKNDKDWIIEVDENPVSDSRPTEVPEISIERDHDDSTRIATEVSPSGKREGGKTRVVVMAMLCLLCLGALAWFLYVRLFGDADSGRHVDSDNVSVLSKPYAATSIGTSPLTDSVLGVAMDIFPLDGLTASLEWEMPDTADRSLVMFMRSADYHPDGRSLGPVVVDGVESEKKSAVSRGAYVAASSSGRPVIGISPADEVEKWARNNAGDFFRQMILLDDGELPRDFLLRGKVERGAIASNVDGELFYVVTKGRESMYDFADALKEYGFVDAVYMTGGDAYSFYRDYSGNSHVNPATLEKIEKYGSQPLPQPLLVFRGAE